MAGFLALGNDKYIGTFTAGVAGIKNGQFVTVDYATGKAVLADATTGDKEVYFVASVNNTVIEQAVSDLDYTTPKDDFLKLHAPIAGEILVTTEFNGVLTKGQKVAVGVNGKVEAIGSRTPKVAFIVKELTNEYGVPAVRLLVL